MDDFEFIPRGDGVSPDCDFFLTVTDDCMLPYISPGTRLPVSCHGELAEMDVGVFMYGGRIMCRQCCEDYGGALLLLCANPARQSENLRIPPEQRDKCLCLGRVLLDSPLPPP